MARSIKFWFKFNADFKSLTETIKDVVLVAEALRTDIDAGNIEEDIKFLESYYVGVIGKIPELSYVPKK